jgi:hypothetical protein
VCVKISPAHYAAKLGAFMKGSRAWVVLLFAMIAVGVWLAAGNARFDDPFITYRFAEHLARDGQFSFNLNDPNGALITTAPLYALLLAALRWLGADVPTTSAAISVISFAIAALALNRILAGRGFIGILAGCALMLSPLLWLTIGFETPLFIAVALWAFALAAENRLVGAGALAGIALGLRGDGALVLAVIVLWVAWRWLSLPKPSPKPMPQTIARVIIAALAIYAPLALWLTWQFGSPVPTTLQTKTAQAMSGLTGFYDGTSYPAGALILLRAYIEQSPLWLIVLAACVFGLVRLNRAPSAAKLIVAWGALHFVGYTLLGVAPYVWYYAPMIPSLALLMSLGADAILSSARRHPHGTSALALGAVLLAPLLIGDLAIHNVISGATPPEPSRIASKILPETKVDVYARVGAWLAANTPADATIGVTELGVMSYTAERHAIDFLGLTTPRARDTIRHGDYLRTLMREQPDYLALTHINSIYTDNPQNEDWFRALYAPVQTFDDARFWGTPITVYRRTRAPITPTLSLDATPRDLGAGWRVLQIESSAREAQAGVPLFVRMKLQAGDALSHSALRVQAVTLIGDDGLPVVSRVIRSALYTRGEITAMDFAFVPQAGAKQTGYVLSTQLIDATTQQPIGNEVRAGYLKVQPPQPQPMSAFAPLSNGVGVSVIQQPITLCANAPTHFDFQWRGGAPISADLTAFVHVRDGSGAVVWQRDAKPQAGAYPTPLWSAGEIVPDSRELFAELGGKHIADGTYTVVVGLYDANGARMSVEPSPYRTPDGGVQIATLNVRCK